MHEQNSVSPRSRAKLVKFLPLLNSSQWPEAFLLFLLFTLAVVFSAFTPPFQSPDEFDHVKRAYLLSKGQFLLKQPAGSRAGGRIDKGLLAYFDIYQKLPFHPGKKLSRDEMRSATEFTWAGKRAFSPAPGTGYYFPAAYAPQALALTIGRVLDWKVDTTYRSARVLSLVFSISLLVLALRVFPGNPFALSILIIPMTVFQFSSASLDAFTIALAVLCVSLYLRLVSPGEEATPTLSLGLTVCILLLVTCRNHLLPLVILPLTVYFIKKDKRFIWHFGAILLLSLFWLLLAIKGSYVSRKGIDLSNYDMIVFYLQHPGSIFQVIANTLGDPEYRRFYVQSFIGILGWLDTRFSDEFYQGVAILLTMIFVLSISFKSLAENWFPRATLLSVAIASGLIAFCAAMITLNPIMPPHIAGVQGRYFTIPVIILGYSISGSGGFHNSFARKAAFALTAVLALVVMYCMPQLLIDRYFIVDSVPGASSSK